MCLSITSLNHKGGGVILVSSLLQPKQAFVQPKNRKKNNSKWKIIKVNITNYWPYPEKHENRCILRENLDISNWSIVSSCKQTELPRRKGIVQSIAIRKNHYTSVSQQFFPSKLGFTILLMHRQRLLHTFSAWIFNPPPHQTKTDNTIFILHGRCSRYHVFRCIYIKYRTNRAADKIKWHEDFFISRRLVTDENLFNSNFSQFTIPFVIFSGNFINIFCLFIKIDDVIEEM